MKKKMNKRITHVAISKRYKVKYWKQNHKIGRKSYGYLGQGKKKTEELLQSVDVPGFLAYTEEKQREKVREAKRKWYQANLEKARALSRLWYQTNSEKVKESHKRWYQANREKFKQRYREKKLKEAINEST